MTRTSPSSTLLAALFLFACSDDGSSVTSEGPGTTETTDDVDTFGTESMSAGDGDGDTTGDGDGDDPATASGDGDGDTGDGDGDTGDGDGDGGDGDGDTGDGDGDTGDGDGDTGDGDGDTGDGDGDGGDGDGDTGDGDGDTTGDPDEPPTVISTSPEDADEGVEAGSLVLVTFSEAMDAQTVTTHVNADQCTGSIQVSADDFVTCVPAAQQPSSNDDTTFELEFLDDLDSATSYQIRVTTDASDAGGTPLAAEFNTQTGFTVVYYHTIVIDGVNDFGGDETFETSSPGHSGFVAWDADYVYVGLSGPDLDADSANTRMVGYFGGMPGSASGFLYDTQQPALPFDARFHFRYEADDSAGGALEWDGNGWVDAGFGPAPMSDAVAASGGFVEMRFLRSDIGSPTDLALHLGMLREEAFNEASWSAVPMESYNDGYDPDYGSHYLFDLLGSVVPSDHVAL